MKKISLGIVVVALFLTVPGSRSPSPAAACTGATPCNVCKNCNYCGHCAKEGGKCGVCKPKG